MCTPISLLRNGERLLLEWFTQSLAEFISLNFLTMQCCLLLSQEDKLAGRDCIGQEHRESNEQLQLGHSLWNANYATSLDTIREDVQSTQMRPRKQMTRRGKQPLLNLLQLQLMLNLLKVVKRYAFLAVKPITILKLEPVCVTYSLWQCTHLQLYETVQHRRVLRSLSQTAMPPTSSFRGTNDVIPLS